MDARRSVNDFIKLSESPTSYKPAEPTGNQLSQAHSPPTRAPSEPRRVSHDESSSQPPEDPDTSGPYVSHHYTDGHLEATHDTQEGYSSQPLTHALAPSRLLQTSDRAALYHPPQYSDSNYPLPGLYIPPPPSAGTTHSTPNDSSSETTTMPNVLEPLLPAGTFLAPLSQSDAIDTSTLQQLSHSMQSYPDDTSMDPTDTTSTTSQQMSQFDYAQPRPTLNSSMTPYDMTLGYDMSGLMSAGYVGQGSYNPGFYPGTYFPYAQPEPTEPTQDHAMQYDAPYAPPHYSGRTTQFSQAKSPQPPSAAFVSRPQSRLLAPIGHKPVGSQLSYESSPSIRDTSSLAPTPRSSDTGGGSSQDDDTRSSIHGSGMSSLGQSSTPCTPIPQHGPDGQGSALRPSTKTAPKDPFHPYKVKVLVSKHANESAIASFRQNSGKGRASLREMIEWCDIVNSLHEMYGIKGGLKPLPPGSNGIVSPPGVSPSRMLAVTQEDIGKVVLRSPSWMRQALRGWGKLHDAVIMANPSNARIKNAFDRYRQGLPAAEEDTNPKRGIATLESLKKADGV